VLQLSLLQCSASRGSGGSSTTTTQTTQTAALTATKRTAIERAKQNAGRVYLSSLVLGYRFKNCPSLVFNRSHVIAVQRRGGLLDREHVAASAAAFPLEERRRVLQLTHVHGHSTAIADQKEKYFVSQIDIWLRFKLHE
jgi:hypothetical protein